MSSIQNVNGLPANVGLSDTLQPADRDLGPDDFMKLLMAQISNQDPLSPFDSDRMMEQISQMNLVQQSMAQNEKLDQLLTSMNSLNNQAAVNLVGQTVDALGDGFTREAEGPETLHFSLATAAQDVTLAIKDENGHVVGNVAVHTLDAGENEAVWDGRDLHGNPVPPGNYTFAVTAIDAAGKLVTTSTAISGQVSEVRFDRGYPVLYVDGQAVTLDQILRIRAGTTDPVAPPTAPGPLNDVSTLASAPNIEAFLNALAQVQG